MQAFFSRTNLRGAMTRAISWSPFLRLLLEREPAIAEALADGRLDLTASSSTPDMPTAKRLRLDRRALALSVAIGDLAGILDLTGVTQALSDFADRALDTAIRAAIAERTPDEPIRGFAGIALGKQGSRELNYSSDIDPILIFDPDTLPCRPREVPEEAAVRIARRVVELLQARDGDGYVLRVDLRLRPSPEATPIALPVDAAIGYYESQALPWERAAFIRARAAAGDIALGTRFLDAIRPFVWRRTLDFGAVRELRGMSRLIRDHHAQGQRLGPGYDLKRGRGGIREAEFYAQIHQLIHGGRDPSVRAPATRDALAALAAAGWIGADEAAALIDGYTLLRTIEHRVQMIDDRQTHALPTGEALDGVARLHGLKDGDALIALLAPRVAAVGTLYDALDDGSPPMLVHDPVALEENLAIAGFPDPAAARTRLEAWRAGTYPALRSPAARAALEAALPTLVPAIGGAPDPQAVLLRFDALLEHLPSAINLFRLLDARPALATLLTLILSHAAPLAEALGRQPALLDGLIDATAFDDVGDVDTLAAEMRGGDAVGYERRLDHVRRVVGEKKFALGVRIVAGTVDPLIVSEGYARVAEAAIAVIGAATVEAFAATHGRVPGSEFAILALGRLGGGQLTHASDLDLIYLFTGDFSAESDGARPLGATLYYNRLAARMTAALSVATAAGPLYTVDTRLRPSGTQGPLVVTVDSFARYQREDAWVWEHMALTRARPIFGSAATRAAVATILRDVLEGARPDRDIVAAAIGMRGDMAAHKPPAGPLDVKLSPGGLVDLEFAVQIAQLVHRTGFDPRLGSAIDVLVAAGHLPPAIRAANDILTRALVILRLVAPDGRDPAAPTRALIARALGLADWAAVVATLTTTQQSVRAIWQNLTGTNDG
ncbi:bifunctional [glutamine synthetase] adenylyltransferase/[glutamine synthetase]-adenylyl-L-tyrosine phosphorylase [Sphingomonas bacterium]|uniref:bifunctional [glutamine synthetase] adenylyltransferase/[glutamine synthetase]-adenylyl-L-tyrosine phosphorylase n=1 Tax=Sphingomonas bacterium TaxID=1895847 RepID=UPI0015753CEA|nr:bifunctional [glutamine synthetase] adenylyltransferase/[glutamine synthetase]-adenylyl-L-tyrosine phosphorylase [Sphingomonas bacterium]